MKERKCKCGNTEKWCGIKYFYTDPEHYSEWRCEVCGTRYGRWSEKELKENESEKRCGRL